jgi:ribosome-associated protein
VDVTVTLETPTIPLAALLKLAGVAESGGRAKHLVLEGCVRVNGETERRRGAQVRPGDVVDLVAEDGVVEARIRLA